MKIIILGGGAVGTSVASLLADEGYNDITIVDGNSDVLTELQERFDLRTVLGSASHPEVLARAGADDADMIVAVTDSDEVNMVACQIAYTLFHTPTKIARVRSSEYLVHKKLFSQDAMPIDVLISPEQLVTDYICRLIEYPGTLQVLDFAGGVAQLVAVNAYHGGPLVGHELQTIREDIPGIDTRVAAIFRKGKSIVPDAHCVIEADDEVFFVAAKENIQAVIAEFRPKDKPVKRIMLAGGGNIGKRLAKALEGKYQIKIIEHSSANAKILSEELHESIVLLGDAADEDLLLEENIGDMDVFCALTNDDEANILSSMLAKRMGAKKVMSLINRPAYAGLVESGSIDVAISARQITIGALLTHVRRGDVVAVHSLRRGSAEAIETIAHGDAKTSKVVGRTIEEIGLRKEIIVGAIVRNEEVIIAHHDTLIESDDHVILFLSDKKYIPDVEKLFQVGITFI